MPTFPTTSIIDSFLRANGDVGANYTKLGGFANGLDVVSNAVTAHASGGGAVYRNTATFGPDVEVYGKINVLPTTAARYARLFARLQNPSSATLISGYYLEWAWNSGAGNDTWKLFRRDNNADTQIGSTLTGSDLVAGDSFALLIIGSQLTAYSNTGGTWAALALTQPDTTYAAAGNIGVHLRDNVVTLDDFGGGTRVPATLSQALTVVQAQAVTMPKTIVKVLS